jgi:hypothetical protein
MYAVRDALNARLEQPSAQSRESAPLPRESAGLSREPSADSGRPLSAGEIDFIANEGHRNAAGGIYATSVYRFARAIEAAHGITPPDAGDEKE